MLNISEWRIVDLSLVTFLCMAVKFCSRTKKIFGRANLQRAPCAHKKPAFTPGGTSSANNVSLKVALAVVVFDVRHEFQGN